MTCQLRRVTRGEIERVPLPLLKKSKKVPGLLKNWLISTVNLKL